LSGDEAPAASVVPIGLPAFFALVVLLLHSVLFHVLLYRQARSSEAAMDR
jgi:hypothetical protein